MLSQLLLLAQEEMKAEERVEPSMFPWYSWVGLIGIVIILVAYKMYRDKSMK